MRTILKYLLTISMVLFLLTNVVQAAEASGVQYIQKNGVSLEMPESAQVYGNVRLRGEVTKEKVKILLVKDSTKTWLDVNLDGNRFDEELWLANGKGTYTITIMVHEYDRKYSYGPSLTIENVGDVNRFLVPAKHIESNDGKIVAQAREIIVDKHTDMEKAKAIFDWVIESIDYDYSKYEEHKKGNYDNTYGALNTLNSKEGICYDYAALIAALGRASGLQVKLVKGKARAGSYEGYHAWNEIYITEINKWIKVDATFTDTGEKEYFDNANFDENHTSQEES